MWFKPKNPNNFYIPPKQKKKINWLEVSFVSFMWVLIIVGIGCRIATDLGYKI